MKFDCALAILVCLISPLIAKVHGFDELKYVGLNDGAESVSEPDNTSQNDGISQVMESLKSKFTVASDHAINQLESVLMIKNHPKVVGGLKSKIDVFRSSLLQHLENDLAELTRRFHGQRSSGPVTDDEKYEFTENVQNKWIDTLSADLTAFEQVVLPKWVNSVRHVWKGIEHEVMDKIQKFKKFIQKRIPTTSATCQLNNNYLMGSIGAPDNFRHDGLVLDVWGIPDNAANRGLFVLSVAGIIVISIFEPIIGACFGLIILIDLASCLMLDLIERKQTKDGPTDINTNGDYDSAGHDEHEVTESSKMAWEVPSFI